MTTAFAVHHFLYARTRTMILESGKRCALVPGSALMKDSAGSPGIKLVSRWLTTRLGGALASMASKNSSSSSVAMSSSSWKFRHMRFPGGDCTTVLEVPLTSSGEEPIVIGAGSCDVRGITIGFFRTEADMVAGRKLSS
jgi:hypothetical protein